jgi:hypothetical protein
MFSITLSHFEKNNMNFCMVGALIIFGKGSSILSLVGYGLVTKTFRVGCTFEMVADKTKCHEFDSFKYQIRMNHFT